MLLEVRGLRTEVRSAKGSVVVLHGLDFDVAAGETLAIVGESGSGKSMTALSIMRLLPEPVAAITAGTIRLDGQDLVTLADEPLRQIIGRDIAMIFQEPMTSLNPVMAVGAQIAETLRHHRGLSRRAARAESIELLRRVGVADPQARIDEYPHRLSGGMRQRVMIAMALACAPKILIADEPTTALDVTIQAQVLTLLADLQRTTGTAIVLITHNLGVVAEVADHVVVMYAGRIVEAAPVVPLFAAPLHPYTQGLIGATPDIAANEDERLAEIPGLVPRLDHLPPGCAFAPRCGRRVEACTQIVPSLMAMPGGRKVACLVAQAEAGL